MYEYKYTFTINIYKLRIYTYLVPKQHQTTVFKWIFGETSIFHGMILFVIQLKHAFLIRGCFG